MTASPEEILAFWFPEAPADKPAVDALMRRWFGSDPQLDEQIRNRFASSMAAAAASRLERWERRARDRLALILLLDQFPRNVFRGTAAAFDQDARALDLTLSGIATAQDQALEPLERVFFYMPLQHSESLSVQNRSVELFDELARSAGSDFMANALANSADYARQHRDIIVEFGRFPHRNAILGRTSTEAEARFLEQGGAMFGQDDRRQRPSNKGRPGVSSDA